MSNHPSRSQRKEALSRNPRPQEIADLREEMGLTQSEFGKLLYTSRRQVQEWEGARRRMPALAWEFAQLILAYPSVELAVMEWRARKTARQTLGA